MRGKRLLWRKGWVKPLQSSLSASTRAGTATCAVWMHPEASVEVKPKKGEVQ